MSGCSAAVIGEQVGGQGSVVVSGSGSTLNNNGVVNIGYLGNGVLTVSSGALVSDTACSSCGTAVSGLYIGTLAGSSGTLVINSGGQLNTIGPVSLGASAGSVGAATVSGTGSSWTNGGFVAIGSGGQGSLTVQNGGAVESTSATIGAAAGSVGNVLVDAGRWTNTGSLAIGVVGTGVVTVENNGSLVSGNTTVGANGTLNIDLPSSPYSERSRCCPGAYCRLPWTEQLLT